MRWLTLSASPYDEKANTPPPSSAGSTLPVTSRHSRKAARPFSGRASSARMLYETIAPASKRDRRRHQRRAGDDRRPREVEALRRVDAIGQQRVAQIADRVGPPGEAPCEEALVAAVQPHDAAAEVAEHAAEDEQRDRQVRNERADALELSAHGANTTGRPLGSVYVASRPAPPTQADAGFARSRARDPSRTGASDPPHVRRSRRGSQGARRHLPGRRAPVGRPGDGRGGARRRRRHRRRDPVRPARDEGRRGLVRLGPGRPRAGHDARHPGRRAGPRDRDRCLPLPVHRPRPLRRARRRRHGRQRRDAAAARPRRRLARPGRRRPDRAQRHDGRPRAAPSAARSTTRASPSRPRS